MAKNYSIKSCRYCNKSFKPINANQKYHSGSCRLWSKVKITSIDQCWPWIGTVGSAGYGIIKINRKWFKAHRLVYKLRYGKIPGNLFVLHKCDNRRCCNPNHLFPGTNQDNMTDMVKKGRVHKKLNINDVQNIRWMINQKIPQTEIAEHFNVSKSAINHINMRKNWAWV